jgi:hypothetical protein
LNSTIWPADEPQPRAQTLRPEYVAAIEALDAKGPLVIGGKSMGGRVASMIPDGLYSAGRIAGLLCLGYPFHPLGKSDQLRTEHLKSLKTPTLIAQGTRDPSGTRDEVSTYQLSKNIEILWLEDGDHDLKTAEEPIRLFRGRSSEDVGRKSLILDQKDRGIVRRLQLPNHGVRGPRALTSKLDHPSGAGQDRYRIGPGEILCCWSSRTPVRGRPGLEARPRRSAHAL